MTIKEYREQCKRTLPDLGSELKQLIVDISESEPQDFKLVDKISIGLNLSHMVTGLSSELSELVSCVGTELKVKVDRLNLKEELGDMYWYSCNYCNLREIPIPEIMATDIPNDTCLDLLIKSIGELNNIVKRYIAYDKDIEKPKELDIIYDLFTALFLFEDTYELDGGIVRQANIDKLRKRYPTKFTTELALNRDLNEERKALE